MPTVHRGDCVYISMCVFINFVLYPLLLIPVDNYGHALPSYIYMYWVPPQSLGEGRSPFRVLEGRPPPWVEPEGVNPLPISSPQANESK